MNNPYHIFSAVSEVTHVPVQTILSPNRRSRAVNARWMCVQLFNVHFPTYTLGDIGDMLGGLDHSSILYICTNWNARVAKFDLAADYELANTRLLDKWENDPIKAREDA